jgi:hypothetical protein
MERFLTSMSLIGFLGIALVGCAQPEKATKEPVPRERPAPKPPILLDRFELHDIKNGNTVSAALLDKQTGRVWVLQGTKGNAMAVFSEIGVFPKPENVVSTLPPCPTTDPLGLQANEPCAPLPSKEGKSQ